MVSDVNRRAVLKGGLLAAVSFIAGRPMTAADGSPLVGFTPVPRATPDGKQIVIADEYEFQTFIPWGEPLTADAPEWQWPPSAEAQAVQVGGGHDGMAFFPLGETAAERARHGLLAINHEYAANGAVFGASTPVSYEQVLASQHAHGISVIEIREAAGRWEVVRDSSLSRRIHLNTEVSMSGPVAGHALVSNRANNPIAGTLNNCANGHTPWGTYLTCEENFNFYFGNGGSFVPDERKERYGLNGVSFYQWHLFDPRFDLANADYANEANRFGWVVEIDPADASAKAVKRTALGRCKHEGASVVEGRDGRVAVYMGDDSGFEFIYKFVSRDGWREMRAAGESPLDDGTLFVARFDEDGTGEWLPLTIDNPALSAEFADQADILVHARVAGTLVGATPMDRPEWTTVGPNGDVFCTLTNNNGRMVADAANPNAPNPYGGIIRWRDEDEHVGTRFTWDHFLICADVYETEQSLGSPDGLMADPDGRLFICTDGRQFEGKPDQLVIADTRTGQLSRLLVGVNGCEITGLTTTPDRRTLFVNVQHPGNGNPQVTSFPAPDDGKTMPRDCTLVVRRKDGGIVGS